jgi:hypothetical protein
MNYEDKMVEECAKLYVGPALWSDVVERCKELAALLEQEDKTLVMLNDARGEYKQVLLARLSELQYQIAGVACGDPAICEALGHHTIPLPNSNGKF